MTALGLRLPTPPARPYAAADPFVQRALGRRYRAIGALVAAAVSVVAAAGVTVLLGHKEPAAVVGAAFAVFLYVSPFLAVMTYRAGRFRRLVMSHPWRILELRRSTADVYVDISDFGTREYRLVRVPRPPLRRRVRPGLGRTPLPRRFAALAAGPIEGGRCVMRPVRGDVVVEAEGPFPPGTFVAAPHRDTVPAPAVGRSGGDDLVFTIVASASNAGAPRPVTSADGVTWGYLSGGVDVAMLTGPDGAAVLEREERRAGTAFLVGDVDVATSTGGDIVIEATGARWRRRRRWGRLVLTSEGGAEVARATVRGRITGVRTASIRVSPDLGLLERRITVLDAAVSLRVAPPAAPVTGG